MFWGFINLLKVAKKNKIKKFFYMHLQVLCTVKVQIFR